jgi:secreted Zn-dependent insulinase-like peptidase
LETLDKEGLVDALKDFHKKYYSANTMSLVICTPDDLDTMQEQVNEIFSGIENKNLEP